MKATITGATGLVGANLAVELLGQGHEVRCTRRSTSRTDHLDGFPIEWVEADLDDQPSLERAFAGAAVVFHCAAQVDISRRGLEKMTRANVEGTRHVLDAVRRARVPRLVHCSSVAACAVTLTGDPVDETRPWNFAEVGLNDGYALTKHQGEQLVQAAAAADVDAVIVNPTYMFGPYDVRPSSGKLIRDVVKGSIPGTTPGYNNFVDVRDVCRGMILAAEKGRRGERYILGHQDMSYHDAMHLIARVAGVRPPRFRIPRPLATALGLIGDLQERLLGREPLINSISVKYGYFPGYRFTSAKAMRELGYRPGPLEPAITDAIAWFRRRGMV
ncbi:MAG TPA: NAD-dependent epimerase/dehydratase family protein [Polyangia bacterium]|jgi:dihydroflavonol-4-reductase|nr:NAD-dependent epimerase/dehydratase family protein [Polyangia bacterium]